MNRINVEKFAWLVIEKSKETDPEKLLAIYESALIAANKFNKPTNDQIQRDTEEFTRNFSGF